MNPTYLKMGGAAVVGAVIGAAVSYYFTRQMMIEKFTQIVEEEPEEVRINEPEIHIPREEPPAKVFKRQKSKKKDKKVVIEDTWNYEEELAQRSPDAPYVIHLDEFMHDNLEYDKISLDYYLEDDVIVDERNTLMANVDDILGEDNLKRFGDGSEDKEIVHIRNERLESDFEITRNNRNYATDVYGYIEHSHKRKLPKFHLDEE